MGTISRTIFSSGTGVHNFGETPKRKFIIPPPVADEQPDDGLTRIRGGGASVITLSHASSYNMSRAKMQESERKVDNIRIKNPDDETQHVDVQRPTTIKLRGKNNPFNRSAIDAERADFWAPVWINVDYAKQPPQDHIEIIEEDIVIKNPKYRK